MRFKKLLSLLMAAVLCATMSSGVLAAKLTKVPTAWMDEHETFLIWYAKEKGWDKEVGLDRQDRGSSPVWALCLP